MIIAVNFPIYNWKDQFKQLTSLPMCGFIAQLVEHRTGIAEVTGLNLVEALIFFRLLLSNIPIRLDLVKHLIIKISERSFTQRFDDSMSSFSSKKSRNKIDNIIYTVQGDKT